MILGFLWTMSQGMAIGASLFDQGVTQFKSGQYQLSAQSLRGAVSSQPGSQLSRYYLACCLVKMHEHRRAVEEYRIAYLLDPASTTGDYCKKALQGYKAALPDLRDSQRVRDELERQSRTSSSRIDHPPDMAKALSEIRRQADYEKGKHRVDEQSREKVVRGVADEQLKAIDQQMAEQIARLSDPIVFGIDGARANPLLIYPDLLKQREDAIRKAAQDEKERILRALDEKTERYKGIQKTRDVALDEVAANLETQMTGSSRSGVRLQPAGTGLYVRNYLPTGTRPPAEVRQAVVRIVDQGELTPESVAPSESGAGSQRPAVPSQTVTGTLRHAPRPVERVVSGKLMLPH